MSDKIFRDPLYNYISIDRDKDSWLLELIDTKEMQRLRRIHQLGVSHFTYPGAEHSRFSHCLGVVHLMQQALDHISVTGSKDSNARRAREPLLAAALLHDVGHGPFSHLFEKCLGVEHEEWTCRIIESEESEVHQVLTKHGISPKDVLELIQEPVDLRSAWKHNLISSQLDVDRLDYIRRDSLFTGAGYGHFDYFRLLHTFSLHGTDSNSGYRDIVWDNKAKNAIEEYIFSRFYMYQNVYMHKTTRGYEKLLHKMWERARELRDDETDVCLVKPIEVFWNSKEPSVSQYLALEESTVLMQIQQWTEHTDHALSDLAMRFLNRKGFVAIEAPRSQELFSESTSKWENALKDLVSKQSEYQPADAYVLKDGFETKVYTAYEPEPETDEASSVNAILVMSEENRVPVEISTLLRRLKSVTVKPKQKDSDRKLGTVRYYIPRECRKDAEKLRKDWKQCL